MCGKYKIKKESANFCPHISVLGVCTAEWDCDCKAALAFKEGIKTLFKYTLFKMYFFLQFKIHF